MFIAALFTVAKAWKQPKCPRTDEWIRKCGACVHVYTHTHTHTGIFQYYSAIEKNLVICNNVGGTEGIMLSEISQRERPIVDNLTYIWNLKQQNTPTLNS